MAGVLLPTDEPFDDILYFLNDPNPRRRYISGEDLACAIRANPDVPIPPQMREYVCRHLEGKVKEPAGRPASLEYPLRTIREGLLPKRYEAYLNWLTRREKALGLKGWAQIQDADWWQGKPSERAARMARRRLGLTEISWQRVRNIVSERSG